MKNAALAFNLLKALGLTQKKIFHSIKKKNFLIQSINIINEDKPLMRLNFKYENYKFLNKKLSLAFKIKAYNLYNNG